MAGVNRGSGKRIRSFGTWTGRTGAGHGSHICVFPHDYHASNASPACRMVPTHLLPHAAVLPLTPLTPQICFEVPLVLGGAAGGAAGAGSAGATSGASLRYEVVPAAQTSFVL